MKNTKENKDSRCETSLILFSGALIGISLLSGAILASSTTSADVVDDVTITVPVSCNMTSELDEAHTATINPGQYQSNIGTTNFNVICNDNSGFAIYAIGYSNEEYGNTKMLATINNELAPTYDINTGTNTSGTNSSWSMKLIPVTSAIAGSTQPYVPTIENGFGSYHIVPSEYTKVATFASNTDFTIGSSLQSTYQVYIDGNKPAGTYAGKVKYTLVHPHNHPTPQADSMLVTGSELSIKMKNLSEGTTDAARNTQTTKIKAIHMADSLPDGFVATAENTVTTPESKHPVYIFFDNTNDAGIMYFYSGGYQVVMNPDSSYAFTSHTNLSDISGLQYWDTSNVTTLQSTFDGNSNLANLSALANWDTSNVTTLQYTFYGNSNLANLSALANWDTSNVTTLRATFQNNNLTDISALANWDTSNVTTLQSTFNGNSNLANLSALANWDTSNVTTLRLTFSGNSSLTSISALASWDTGSVTDLTATFQVDSNLTDISALANWDTSNVTTLYATFLRNTNLTDISALANWDTSNVTALRMTFADNSSLTSISALANWDTSKVTNMNFTFGMTAGKFKTGDPIIDLSPLANWDVSNVTDMTSMFQNINIASFLPLRNWNVGKVQNFNNTFNQTSKSTTTTLAGLENWNVSSATNMGSMFADSVSLTDASAINGWDVRNVIIGTGAESVDEGFNHMFSGSPVYPTFTLRPGTWNSNGTYIPSE